MPDQNNAPERIWLQEAIGPEHDRTWCAEQQDDDDTLYIRADLARADRAAPEGQVRALDVDDLAQIIRVVDGSNTKGAGELAEAILAALTPPPAAPMDNTALVEALQNMMTFARSKMDDPTRADDMRIFKDAHAALASLEASPASQQEAVTEADLAAARAEIEQLTKERDEARAGRRFTLGLLDRTMTERDEARAQVVGAFEAAASVAWADRESGLTVNTKIRALTPDDAQAALQSMLADAERDMRQRAADACKAYWGHPDAESSPQVQYDAILALPLKHADREEGK